jgi:pimeloyl-ACP methyl ester carboxylesterase
MPRRDWVDPALYPFRSHHLDIGAGRLHYVDEGEGPVLVLVHGTPTWSFLYRRLIAGLSREYRVVALDHLGFGLSDKPQDWGYRPEDHARNLAVLIDHLELRDLTLVVHDFGGPIGLAYAIEHPENVRALVLFNTWMWSLRGTSAETVSKLAGGWLGRLLYQRFNFSPRVLVRAAFGDKRKLTREVRRHYVEAFPTPSDRLGPWVLARELAGSSDWYEGLWARRERLAEKPALILWGMKDPAFGADALERWKAGLDNAHVVEFPESGHCVQEEAPAEAEREIRAFLSGLP